MALEPAGVFSPMLELLHLYRGAEPAEPPVTLARTTREVEVAVADGLLAALQRRVETMTVTEVEFVLEYMLKHVDDFVLSYGGDGGGDGRPSQQHPRLLLSAVLARGELLRVRAAKTSAMHGVLKKLSEQAALVEEFPIPVQQIVWRQYQTLFRRYVEKALAGLGGATPDDFLRVASIKTAACCKHSTDGVARVVHGDRGLMRAVFVAAGGAPDNELLGAVAAQLREAFLREGDARLGAVRAHLCLAAPLGGASSTLLSVAQAVNGFLNGVGVPNNVWRAGKVWDEFKNVLKKVLETRKTAGDHSGTRTFLVDAVMLLAQPAFIAAAASDLIDYLERKFCTAEACTSEPTSKSAGLVVDAETRNAVRTIFVGSCAWDLLTHGCSSSREWRLDVLLSDGRYLSDDRMTLACARVVNALLRVKAHGIALEPEMDVVMGGDCLELMRGGGCAPDWSRAPALTLAGALCMKLLRMDATWAAVDLLDAVRPALRADCGASAPAVAGFVASVVGADTTQLGVRTTDRKRAIFGEHLRKWLPEILPNVPRDAAGVCQLAAADALRRFPDVGGAVAAGAARDVEDD